MATLLLLLAPHALAQQTTIIDEAAEALRTDPVYVHPEVSADLSESDAEELRDRIEAADAGAIYIAVLPERARLEAGGATESVLQGLYDTLLRDGTYAVVVGTELRAGSTVAEGARSAADEAVRQAGGEGTAAVLLAFVDEMARTASGEAPAGDGDGGATGLGFIPLLLLVGGGALALSALRRRRTRNVEEARRFEEVKQVATEDLVALGEDLRATEIDVEMASDPDASADYERALGSYERASAQLDRARRVEDLREVSAACEEGRWAMASARARLEGRPLPERRPPCFFDPRHGPSVRDVDWAPPDGAVRAVPACADDASRVERGEDPAAREISVGGRMTPYYNAPAYYGPWAGGYFGGFGLFE
ncbi:MAG TPA: hypothetical protein VHK89_02625, partial [Actinomycetota bacterium]|nr:hypothetical protein [Actinomycetota bacterium]